ncbi:MAG: hypothetical protein WAV18_15380 [Roseiarcus sp.]
MSRQSLVEDRAVDARALLLRVEECAALVWPVFAAIVQSRARTTAMDSG